MRTFNLSVSKLCAVLVIGWLASAAPAQDRAAPEINAMCKSVVATVMVGKVSCTAALCNTGASQGGFTGFLTQMANRGAIDAVSFSTGIGAQLTTALKQTGCFTVLDAAGMEEMRKEMEALGKALPPPPSVDYVVKASITKAEYVLDESGFLGFKKTTATSSLTIDTKLVGAQSGAISEAGSYDATSERTSSGLALGVYSSNSDAAKRGTPFADVARDVVAKATVGLATRILAQAEVSKPSVTSPQQPLADQGPASAPQ